MKNNAILIFSLSIFFISIISSAPSPWGIAINPETEQCTAFWPGDEFSRCSLPEGWNYHSPSEYINNTHIIKTEFGNCNFTKGLEEKCCNQLNLEYIKDPGIKCIETDWAKQQEYSGINFIGLFSGVIIILLIIGLIIFFYRKHKS